MLALVKKSLTKWVEAAVILVIGILCIVAGAQFNSYSSATGDTLNTISMVLGISFLVVGSLGIVLALIAAIFSRLGFLNAALPSGTALAIGIWFVVNKRAYEMIDLGISFVPYLLIVVGAIVLLDTLFIILSSVKSNTMKTALPSIIIGFIIAASAIVLGCLCIGSDPVISGGAQLIIFGILVIIYSCFMVLETFISIPTVVKAK